MQTKFNISPYADRKSLEFIVIDKHGTTYTRKVTKDTIRIGSSNSCEIFLKEPSISDVQVICRFICDYLYIIESGTRKLVKVNGVHKRQHIISSVEDAIIKINNSWIIFSGKGKANKPQKYGRLPDARVTICLKDDLRVSTTQDYLLIGSSNKCHIRSKVLPEFAGLFYFDHTGFYFEKIGNCDVNSESKILLLKKQIFKSCELYIEKILVKIEVLGDLVEHCKRICSQKLEKEGLNLMSTSTVEELTIPLENNLRVSLGRSNNCNISFDSQQLSRLHAQLMRRDNVVFISDNQSMNGTYINSVKIETGKAVPGDEVRFGTFCFLLMYDYEASWKAVP